MDKVKYALIGFGGIAENRIAKEGFACDRERFNALKKAELIGATDINPARKEAVEALNLKWYDSTEAILKDGEIDSVFIATNNASHAVIAQQALRAGKHVIVEKPMTTNSVDAAKLMEQAIAYKLSLSVDHMMTENSWNMMVKDYLKAGNLGEVNDACFHMEFSYGSTPEEAASWRCSSPEEFGGPIGDVASHCFYMAEFLFDSEIVELACVYFPRLMGIEVEDGAYIKYKLASGLTGSVKVGFNEPRGGLVGTLSNLGYEIYGSEGVLRTYGTMFQLSGHGGEPVPVRVDVDFGHEQKKLYVNSVHNIYQGVIERHAASVISQDPMDGYEGYHNLKLVLAAHESAKNGGKIIKIS